MGKGFEKNSAWFNRHHLYEKKDGGTNHTDNIKRMEVVRHRALHVLFNPTPDTTPLWKLDTLLDLHSSVLIEECKGEIGEILEFWKKEGREAYKPGIIKKGR